MPRYIRFKTEKQQINFLNCNHLDRWSDTCYTRATTFIDVCTKDETNCDCDIYQDQKIYKWVLDPNDYDCINNDKWSVEKEYVFLDNVWTPTGNKRNKNILEVNSRDCFVPQCDYIPSDEYYECVGYDKYKKNIKRCTKYEGGYDYYPDDFQRGDFIEHYSVDCGFNPTSDLIFEYSGDTPMKYTINGAQYTTEFSPLAVNTKTKLGIDTITSMRNMFKQSGGTNNITRIIKLPDSSLVTDMNSLFSRCYNLTEINFKNFKTDSCADFSFMFDSCESLTELDLSSFNTSKVTNIRCLCQACSHLKKVNLSSFDTRLVQEMERLFVNCYDLEEVDLSNFRTDSCTNFEYMFHMWYSGSKLSKINLSNWVIKQTSNTEKMFHNCQSLKTITMDNCNCETINRVIDELTKAGIRDNVTIYSNTGCEGTVDPEFPYDLSFEYDTNVSEFSRFNLNSRGYAADVTPYNKTLKELDIDVLNYINFNNNNSLTIINKMPQLKTVTSLNSLFRNCTNLRKINRINLWDVSNVEDMTLMFQNCVNLKGELDLSNWNVSKCENFWGIFRGTKLSKINISNWKFENASAYVMFEDNELLEEINMTNCRLSRNFECPRNVPNLKRIIMRGCICDDIINVKNQLFRNNIKHVELVTDESSKDCLKQMHLQFASVPTTFKVFRENATDTVTVNDLDYYSIVSDDTIGYSFKDSTLSKVIYLPVTNKFTSFDSLFENCVNLEDIKNYDLWDDSNVTSIKSMFKNTPSYKGNRINIKSNKIINASDAFNTSKMYNVPLILDNATTIDRMYANMNFEDRYIAVFNIVTSTNNQNITYFNMSNIDSMIGLFENNPNTEIIELHRWNLKPTVNTTDMFKNCQKLEYLYINDSNCETINILKNALVQSGLPNVPIYSNSGCEGTLLNGDYNLAFEFSGDTPVNVTINKEYGEEEKILTFNTSPVNVDLRDYGVNNIFRLQGLLENQTNVTKINHIPSSIDNGMYSQAFVNTSIEEITFNPKFLDSVWSVSSLLYGCKKLKKAILTNLKFMSPNFAFTFSECPELVEIDFSNSSFEDNRIPDRFGFYNCAKLKTIKMIGCTQEFIDKIKSSLIENEIPEGQVTIVTQ